MWSKFKIPFFICVLDQTHIAQILLVNDAKIDAKTLNDWTPLHFAAERNNDKAAELLINHGADLNAKRFDGKKGFVSKT